MTNEKKPTLLNELVSFGAAFLCIAGTFTADVGTNFIPNSMIKVREYILFIANAQAGSVLPFLLPIFFKSNCAW